jgi:hypothetical protein
MAAPAAAGSAALILEAYRDRYDTDPSATTGRPGVAAGPGTLLRAALMNSAGGELFESRWILTILAGGLPDCPPELDPAGFGICDFIDAFGAIVGASTVRGAQRRVRSIRRTARRGRWQGQHRPRRLGPP